MIHVRLDELLKERGRSLYWLARETGIPEGSLRKIRRGETTEISFRVLEALCEALGCEPGELIVRGKGEGGG